MNNEDELKPPNNRNISIRQGKYNENIGRDYKDYSTNYFSETNPRDSITGIPNNLPSIFSNNFVGREDELIWILSCHVVDFDATYGMPSEIFDIKETCFQKYSGDWQRKDEHLYFINDCSKFEQYKSMDYLTLSTLPFTQKTDVTE
ncbi:MAG: hypothetical protein AB4372_04465 [Xenococcus sp. (in: cyanobacteria)]